MSDAASEIQEVINDANDLVSKLNAVQETIEDETSNRDLSTLEINICEGTDNEIEVVDVRQVDENEIEVDVNIDKDSIIQSFMDNDFDYIVQDNESGEEFYVTHVEFDSYDGSSAKFSIDTEEFFKAKVDDAVDEAMDEMAKDEVDQRVEKLLKQLGLEELKDAETLKARLDRLQKFESLIKFFLPEPEVKATESDSGETVGSDVPGPIDGIIHSH